MLSSWHSRGRKRIKKTTTQKDNNNNRNTRAIQYNNINYYLCVLGIFKNAEKSYRENTLQLHCY